MIFSVYLIDADNGILLLEKNFKPLHRPSTTKDLAPGVIAEFFSAINSFIDEIQAAMRKGRDVSNMNRTLLAENSTVSMHYQPEGRVLISSISDPDDDTDVIVAGLRRIGEKFWKKHRENIEEFRVSMDKTSFKGFIPDIELVLRDGKVAEIFPRLAIPIKTLQRLRLMGVINDEDYRLVEHLDKELVSPLSLSKSLGKTKNDVMEMLKKLEALDIINKLKIPEFS